MTGRFFFYISISFPPSPRAVLLIAQKTKTREKCSFFALILKKGDKLFSHNLRFTKKQKIDCLLVEEIQ